MAGVTTLLWALSIGRDLLCTDFSFTLYKDGFALFLLSSHPLLILAFFYLIIPVTYFS
jgi:hypothetical protein